MIANEKRKLTYAAAENLAKALELTGKRRRYLLGLAKLQQSKSESERAATQKDLIRIRSTLDESKLKIVQYRFLSEWHYPVIYVLVGMDDFVLDLDAIAKRIGKGITAKKVLIAYQLTNFTENNFV